MAEWNNEESRRLLRELNDAHKAYLGLTRRASNLSAGERPVPRSEAADEALDEARARRDVADEAFRASLADPVEGAPPSPPATSSRLAWRRRGPTLGERFEFRGRIREQDRGDHRYVSGNRLASPDLDATMTGLSPDLPDNLP